MIEGGKKQYAFKEKTPNPAELVDLKNAIEQYVDEQT